MPKKLTKEQFIEKSNLIHNNEYDYTKSEYKNTTTKVIVTCKVHGDFPMSPVHHFRGHKCPKCRLESGKSTALYDRDTVIEMAKSIHGDRFMYDRLIYTTIMDKHEIGCSICGCYFMQCLSNHIHRKSNGCPNCQDERGWTRSQWIMFCKNKKCVDPMVYIIKMTGNNESFIKIGITSNSIYERMRKIPYEYEVIKTHVGSPLFVYDKEIELHRQFREYKYTPLLSFKGEGECYSIYIQQLLQ